MKQQKKTAKESTTEAPAKKKVVPRVVGMAVSLPKKIRIPIPEFKDRLEFIEGFTKHRSTEENEQYKQLLKNLYLDILAKHSSDIKNEQLQIAYRRADDWGNIAITRAVSNVKDLLKVVEGCPGKTEGTRDTHPLHKKIHWNDDSKEGIETLKKHLEGLKAAGFITYNKKIDDVLNGTETPRTAECESEDRLILYIFTIWHEKKFIKESFLQRKPETTYDESGKEIKSINLSWNPAKFIVDNFKHSNGTPFIAQSISKIISSGDRKVFTKKQDGTFEYRDTDLHAALSEILK